MSEEIVGRQEIGRIKQEIGARSSEVRKSSPHRSSSGKGSRRVDGFSIRKKRAGSKESTAQRAWRSSPYAFAGRYSSFE
jgi:hypothetical protein